jgi:hypothetical protein
VTYVIVRPGRCHVTTSTKPNAGKPCHLRLYFATLDRARQCFKVRRGSWTPEKCEHCDGWHLERARRRST